MSSTRTMSRSLDRPMMISRFMRSGNSPPWYLPEMKRSAKRGRSLTLCNAAKILVPKARVAQANALPRTALVGRDRLVDERVGWRSQRVDDAPVHLFGHDQARVAQRHRHRVGAVES